MTTPLIRRDAVARTTGTRTLLIDTSHPDNDLDPDGGRWATVCDGRPGQLHGGVINHPLLENAVWFAAHPEEWCEFCMEEVKERSSSS